MTENPPNSNNRPLAIGVALVAGLYAILYRFVPYDVQAYLLWPFGALCLYSGARLRPWVALALVFAVQAGVDLTFYATNQWDIPKATYVSFGLFVLLGLAVRPLLRKHWGTAAAGLGGASVIGYAVFFLLTNAEAWLTNALPGYAPHTFASLMRAYGEGLEFLRARPWQVVSNPLCVGVVFGAHYLLAKAYFPAERFGAERVR